MDVTAVRLFVMAVAGWWADERQATVAYLFEETASSGRASVAGSASPMKNAVGLPCMDTG